MQIRPGLPSDARSIADLVASFQSEVTEDPSGLGAEVYLASVSEAAERQYLESDRYVYLLAEEGGRLVGFIALRDGTHLFHLFVARDRQRKGVARRLWQQARDGALSNGHAGPFTVNSSTGAIAVYEAFGFTPSGPLTRVHGITFLPMCLRIVSS